ncbi:MAG: PDZ domain-containing protein, partial [Prevotella sp.]
VDRGSTLGYWVVTGLYEGGKAEKAGLQIDDHILQLNGMPVGELDIDWQYADHKNLRRLDLLIERDGKRLNIGFDTEDPYRI